MTQTVELWCLSCGEPHPAPFHNGKCFRTYRLVQVTQQGPTTSVKTLHGALPTPFRGIVDLHRG